MTGDLEASLLELVESQMLATATEALTHSPGRARAINRLAAAEWAVIALALRATLDPTGEKA